MSIYYDTDGRVEHKSRGVGEGCDNASLDGMYI